MEWSFEARSVRLNDLNRYLKFAHRPSPYSVSISSESISRLDEQADMKHETRDELLAFPPLCFRMSASPASIRVKRSTLSGSKP
jgi:hypothetical protein